MCVRRPPVVLGMKRMFSRPTLTPGPDRIGARKSASMMTRAVSYASIFGAVIDDQLGDEVRITVIAAGIDGYEHDRDTELNL